MNRSLLSILILLGMGAALWGQERHHDQDAVQQEKHARHLVAAGFGFTFVPVAAEIGTSQASGLFVPSVGLDYMFHLAKRWEIGLMLDYELDHYMIVDSQVERERAFLAALVGMYKISEHWGVFTGGGIEIEPHEHLAVFRLGTEYSIDLKKNWLLIPKFYFDLKKNYDTWSLQLSIGKKF